MLVNYFVAKISIHLGLSIRNEPGLINQQILSKMEGKEPSDFSTLALKKKKYIISLKRGGEGVGGFSILNGLVKKFLVR